MQEKLHYYFKASRSCAIHSFPSFICVTHLSLSIIIKHIGYIVVANVQDYQLARSAQKCWPLGTTGPISLYTCWGVLGHLWKFLYFHYPYYVYQQRRIQDCFKIFFLSVKFYRLGDSFKWSKTSILVPWDLLHETTRK